jgi:hypothetical protein
MPVVGELHKPYKSLGMTYIWIRCIATLGFTPFRPCSPAPIKANTVLLAKEFKKLSAIL